MQQSILNTEVSLFQGCPLRVLLYHQFGAGCVPLCRRLGAGGSHGQRLWSGGQLPGVEEWATLGTCERVDGLRPLQAVLGHCEQLCGLRHWERALPCLFLTGRGGGFKIM